MVYHICKDCNKVFNKKSTFINHINKKIKCNENQYNNECIYCKKKFITKGNVTRHIKNNCSIYKNIQKEKQDLFNKLVKLEEKNKELNNKNKELKDENIKIKTQLKQNSENNIISLNNTININNNLTNNGIINNITIVAYGKEKIDNISDKEILNAVSKGFNTVEYLTKTVHFNKKYPEYHNVYIPNIKESYAMVFDGIKWKLLQKKDVIENIYLDKKLFIDDNLENFTKSLPPYKIKSLNKWLQSDDNFDNKEDMNKIKNIKKNIELLLFNEKNKPLKLKEQLENQKKIV